MAPSTRSQTKASRQIEPLNELTDPDGNSRSRQLRQAEAVSYRSNDGVRAKRRNVQDDPLVPRRFTIDLSSPPEQRYLEVCKAFQDDMLSLRGLFEEVVGGMIKFIPNRALNWICWMLLRSVYDEEENAELKVI